MKTDGRTALGRIDRLLNRLVFGGRRRLRRIVELEEDGHRHVFLCRTHLEFRRAYSLIGKEEGTVDWIRRNAKPGDVFYDIGANVGVYTFLAARRVLPGGAVYAFEPHGPTFARLIDNIVLNGMTSDVIALSCALHDQDGLFPFHYSSHDSGVSGSQLAGAPTASGQTDAPTVAELKSAITVDSLIATGNVRPPDLVKIDVDGNEYRILCGMRRLLQGGGAPRSLQVEMNAENRSEISALLQQCGYEEHDRHYTASGKKWVANGGDPEAYPYNLVFNRIAA